MNKEQPEKKIGLLAKLADGPLSSDRRQTRERMKLAARMDDLIRGKGYSKQQFAGLLGKEPSVVSKWLSGTHNFTTDTLFDIAFHLNVEMADLFVKTDIAPLYVQHYAVARLADPTPLDFYAHGHSGTVISGNDILIQAKHYPLVKTSALSAGLVFQAIQKSKRQRAADKISNERDLKSNDDYPFKIIA